MESTNRSSLAFLAVGLIGLIVGYFAGREHLKYEMRTAMESAAAEMQKSFASAFGVQDSSEATEVKNAPTPPQASEPQPLQAALVAKSFRDSDVQAGIYQEAITFSVSFSNLSGKDIRAFDGVLGFVDLLDNPVLSSSLAINEEVKAGTTLNWDGQLDYNQFMDAHRRLRGESKENLKLVFTVGKVLFSDGTTKSYK